MIPTTKVNVSCSGPQMDKPAGNSVAIKCAVSTGPPKYIAAVTGTNKMAKNIIIPWMQSVQLTARKPPKKV